MILQDSTSIQDLTNTVGTTLISDTAQTGTVQIVGITGIGIILLLFIIAHYLDRKYSRPLYQRSELKEEEEV
jgi:hypothetical protein